MNNNIQTFDDKTGNKAGGIFSTNNSLFVDF